MTSQEQACHVGCGELARGKKKNPVTERPAKALVNQITTTSTVAPKAVPKMQVPANFRLIWSKSIVDEQDIDSSSSEDPSDTPESSPFATRRDPFLILSSILPPSLLPQSYRITKSTFTYFGNKNLSPAPIGQETLRETVIPASTMPVKDSMSKQSEATVAPSPSDDNLGRYDFLLRTRFLNRLTPEQKEKFSNITHFSLKRYEGTGLAEWTAIFGFCIFFVFMFLITLFRSTAYDSNYLPVSVSSPSNSLFKTSSQYLF